MTKSRPIKAKDDLELLKKSSKVEKVLTKPLATVDDLELERLKKIFKDRPDLEIDYLKKVNKVLSKEAQKLIIENEKAIDYTTAALNRVQIGLKAEQGDQAMLNNVQVQLEEKVRKLREAGVNLKNAQQAIKEAGKALGQGQETPPPSNNSPKLGG